MAEANGAFPDSLSLLVPADRPRQITLATNFGLIATEDDAQSWFWTCELPLASYGAQYQLGAPTRDRLFAISSEGLIFSDSAACDWNVASGSLTNASVSDYFPDAGNSQRVFAIAVPGRNAMLAPYSVFESNDGGTTFPTLRYAAPLGDVLTGVEVSRSDPRTLYLTGYRTTDLSPRLIQSVDGGATWHDQPLSAALGSVRSIRLIAIDPQKPAKLFLRVSGPLPGAPADAGANGNGERLVVTEDAGATVRAPLTLPDGALTSFVRMPSGSIVTAGAIGLDPVAWRSTDGGATFVALPSPPHIKALAARNAVLYASADNFVDDFAIGVSHDEGMTWQHLMSYADVSAVGDCVHVACRDTCLMLADMSLWGPQICDAVAHVDAGSSDAPVPPADAAATDAAQTPKPKAKSGCSCAATPGPNADDDAHQYAPWSLVAVLALVLFRPRRQICNNRGRV